MASENQVKIKLSKNRKKEIVIGFMFLAPAMIGFLWFYLYPILMTFYMSFFKWTMSMKHTFTGFGNYVFAFTKDPSFWVAVKTTSVYSVISVLLSLFFGFILAAMLNRPRKTTGFFRTLYYLPCMVSAGAPMIMIWQWLLGPDGALNHMLGQVGIQGPKWLLASPWTMVSIIVIGLWSLGGMMLIFISGLKGISDDYYEAADIDGAGYFTKIFKITIPLLTPIILYNAIISLVSSLQVFTVVYVLTGTNLKTWALSIYTQMFKVGAYGYAAAQAALLFIVIMALTILVFKTSGKWVFYGDDN